MYLEHPSGMWLKESIVYVQIREHMHRYHMENVSAAANHQPFPSQIQ